MAEKRPTNLGKLTAKFKKKTGINLTPAGEKAAKLFKAGKEANTHRQEEKEDKKHKQWYHEQIENLAIKNDLTANPEGSILDWHLAGYDYTLKSKFANVSEAKTELKKLKKDKKNAKTDKDKKKLKNRIESAKKAIAKMAEVKHQPGLHEYFTEHYNELQADLERLEGLEPDTPKEKKKVKKQIENTTNKMVSIFKEYHSNVKFADDILRSAERARIGYGKAGYLGAKGSELNYWYSLLRSGSDSEEREQAIDALKKIETRPLRIKLLNSINPERKGWVRFIPLLGKPISWIERQLGANISDWNKKRLLKKADKIEDNVLQKDVYAILNWRYNIDLIKRKRKAPYEEKSYVKGGNQIMQDVLTSYAKFLTMSGLKEKYGLENILPEEIQAEPEPTIERAPRKVRQPLINAKGSAMPVPTVEPEPPAKKGFTPKKGRKTELEMKNLLIDGADENDPNQFKDLYLGDTLTFTGKDGEPHIRGRADDPTVLDKIAKLLVNAIGKETDINIISENTGIEAHHITNLVNELNELTNSGNKSLKELTNRIGKQYIRGLSTDVIENYKNELGAIGALERVIQGTGLNPTNKEDAKNLNIRLVGHKKAKHFLDLVADAVGQAAAQDTEHRWDLPPTKEQIPEIIDHLGLEHLKHKKVILGKPPHAQFKTLVRERIL